jgi:hypothetical protein
LRVYPAGHACRHLVGLFPNCSESIFGSFVIDGPAMSGVDAYSTRPAFSEVNLLSGARLGFVALSPCSHAPTTITHQESISKRWAVCGAGRGRAYRIRPRALQPLFVCGGSRLCAAPKTAPDRLSRPVHKHFRYWRLTGCVCGSAGPPQFDPKRTLRQYYRQLRCLNERPRGLLLIGWGLPQSDRKGPPRARATSARRLAGAGHIDFIRDRRSGMAPRPSIGYIELD